MVNKSGFSLIELIVVIGLLSLLMLAISSTMLMSIVSSNRVRIATSTKQAGNYALGQMQILIRNARDIKTCAPASLTITNLDGGNTQIYFADSRVASNSGVYLTPENTKTTNFVLSCEPIDHPTLVNLSFDLKDNSSDSNPILHFATSINLRNQ